MPCLLHGVADDPLGGVEEPRGPGPVAAGALEGVEDQVLLVGRQGVLERLAGQGPRDLGGLQAGGQVVGVDRPSLAHQHRPLDAVLQLAHVARPVVAHQQVDGAGGDAADVLALVRRVLLDEVVGEERDVGLSLPQRRQEDPVHVEAVEEVLAELALRRTASSRSLLVAATTRTLTWIDSTLPSRSISFSCSTRRSLIWMAGESSPISSRKRVPPWASSKRPFFCDRASVKAPGS